MVLTMIARRIVRAGVDQLSHKALKCNHRSLFIPSPTHPDAAQPVTTDLECSTQREVQHSAARKRPAVKDGALDFLSVLKIGDDEDRA